jgi:hypothetical protein
MADGGVPLRIIHTRSRHRPIRKGEAARLDHVDRHAEACAQPQDGADIAGNLGLEEREPHGPAR